MDAVAPGYAPSRSNHCKLCSQLTFATSNVSITHITRLAATDHGAQGKSVNHLADGIGSTRMRNITWVLALAIEAG